MAREEIGRLGSEETAGWAGWHPYGHEDREAWEPAHATKEGSISNLSQDALPRPVLPKLRSGSFI